MPIQPNVVNSGNDKLHLATEVLQLFNFMLRSNVYNLFVNDKTTSRLVESRSISENNIDIKRESAIPTYTAYISSSYFHTTNVY